MISLPNLVIFSSQTLKWVNNHSFNPINVFFPPLSLSIYILYIYTIYIYIIYYIYTHLSIYLPFLSFPFLSYPIYLSYLSIYPNLI